MDALVIPTWMWLVFGGLVAVLVVVDLAAHRGDHVDSKRRALAWSLGWVGIAVAFGVFVATQLGRTAGEEYFAAYLLEKSLSIDNLFLFLVIFAALKIPSAEQRRVLTWGIIGALVSRALFIGLGGAALHEWRAISYVFGAILLVTAAKLLRAPAHDAGPPKILGWLTKRLPWTTELHGHHFIARVPDAAGVVRRVGTPLLLALLAIELTDVVFALDSVPAAFAVSDEPFIVYSSNVFAILGLRALYVVLAQLLADLRYLRFALAAVLAFAGGKLIAAQLGVHVSPALSVAVIVVCISTAVVASLLAARRDRSDSSRPSRPARSSRPGSSPGTAGDIPRRNRTPAPAGSPS